MELEEHLNNLHYFLKTSLSGIKMHQLFNLIKLI